MSAPAIASPAASTAVGVLDDGTEFHVAIGRLETSGELVRCHLCGGWFRSVGAHLRAHGWDRARYRAAFGLERGQSLEGEVTRRRRARAMRHRRAHDPAVRAGCEIGLRWAATGRLSRAAAAAAQGRRQPEQRRRKTLRALAAISVQVRAEATTRASVARLRETADGVAEAAGHASIGSLVRDRVAAGESLAGLSRAAGLHKDWLTRHLPTVDPDTARDIAVMVSGPRRPRHDTGLLERIRQVGFDDVGSFLRLRHLQEHRSVRSIAEEVGMSRHAIQAAMTRHGVTRTPHTTLRRRNRELADAAAAAVGTDDLARWLADRRSAGLSWRRIADECGRPPTWLRRYAGQKRDP